MDSMRSGLISSLATPWPEDSFVTGDFFWVRLAGVGLAGFFAADFFAGDFFAMDFVGFTDIGMIVP